MNNKINTDDVRSSIEDWYFEEYGRYPEHVYSIPNDIHDREWYIFESHDYGNLYVLFVYEHNLINIYDTKEFNHDLSQTNKPFIDITPLDITFNTDTVEYNFDNDEKRSLYTFLNEKIFCIKEGNNKEDENVMKIIVKELISQYDLHTLINEWLKPFIDECDKNGRSWSQYSAAGGFDWSLNSSVGHRRRGGGSCLCKDHWEIYNDTYKEENVNIKIFNDHIEFIEDSKFTDFCKEEMYSLYEFLNERIFDDVVNEEKSKTDDEKTSVKESSNKSNMLGTKSESNNIKVDTDADINTYGDGAIRSSKKGKGRYDLIPGCVMLDVLRGLSGNIRANISDPTMKCILMKRIFDHDWISAIVCLTELGYDGETPIDSFNKMIKELALHYENGAEIYGENNWKKGIPKESFISSGIRHTQQWLSGLDDEPHLISAIWNFTNAEWCEHKEKLYK